MQEDHYYPFGMNISALSSTAPLSKPNQFKYNGKEFDSDLDLDWMDYGARRYDAQIGRWAGVDALADKYNSISPYTYVANNPIIFIDPNGKEIILGANTSRDLTNLAQIAATSGGRLVLDRLISSRNVYRTKHIFLTKDAVYDGSGLIGKPRTIYYPRSVWIGASRLNGGYMSSMIVMGHEIQHAYDHERQGLSSTYTSSVREHDAAFFGNYLRSVYGKEDLRTVVGTTKLFDNEFVYNPNNEKVTNFQQEDKESSGKTSIMGFSYDINVKGEEPTKSYILSIVVDGEYSYRTFTDKDEYDAAVKRYSDAQGSKGNGGNNE